MFKINFLLLNAKVGGGVRVILELMKVIESNNINTTLYLLEETPMHKFPLNNNVKFEVRNKNRIMLPYVIMKSISLIARNKEICIVSGPLITPFLKNKHFFYNYIQGDDYTLFDDGKVLKYKPLIKIYKLITKYISYRKSDVTYIFNSNYSYEKFIEISKRIDVPKNIVSPAIDHKIFNNKYRDDKNSLVIGTVARSHPNKGLKVFLESLSLISEEVLKNIEIYIISKEDLTDFEIPINVKLFSPKDDEELSKIYQQIDIFISTSYREGFGLPGLEAMACGCALITSDSGGILDYADNKNSIIYQPGDAMALTKSIEQLVQNKRKIQEIREAGMKEAQRFTWENSEKQLLEILKRDGN